MRTHVITDPSAIDRGPAAYTGAIPRRAAPACWGAWRPALTLGAQSMGGLMLPDASASASTMYAPRGVWIDAERIIACDSGNHRVLIWHSWPEEDGAPADVVLGQPDAVSEGPAAGGRDVRGGMHLPTGVLVIGERLVVADAWHHRLLVWDRIPDVDGTAPDHVIGQPTTAAVEPNRGGEPSGTSFYWPFGIALIDGRFHVADTGNRRVLIWRDGLPLDGTPADVVLGQPTADGREENRGEGVGPASFRWPHAISPSGSGIFVADAGNHRILRWDAHPDADVAAHGVIGQPDFVSGSEFPYGSQEGQLRFPYAICGPGLAVADTANNRILLWEAPPHRAVAPDAVLAQLDFAGAGENRWEAVAPDTLCWPYGLARSGPFLAVADSGNNRVVIWKQEETD